jgi:hypothetical protein
LIPELTAEDKLKMREAQLNRTSLAMQRAHIELALMNAHAAEVKLLAELSAKAGCELDPQTLACKPEPAKPEESLT